MYYEVTNKLNGLSKSIFPEWYSAEEIHQILKFYTNHTTYSIRWICHGKQSTLNQPKTAFNQTIDPNKQPTSVYD